MQYLSRVLIVIFLLCLCVIFPARLRDQRSKGSGIQDSHLNRLLQRDPNVTAKAMARTCVGQSDS